MKLELSLAGLLEDIDVSYVNLSCVPSVIPYLSLYGLSLLAEDIYFRLGLGS